MNLKILILRLDPDEDAMINADNVLKLKTKKAVEFSKRRKKAKPMEISKVKAIKLDEIDVDSILPDPAIPEIFYFKHDVRVFQIIIFIGNSDVKMM